MTVTETAPADVPAPPQAEPSIAKLAAALAAVQADLPRVSKSETGEVKGTTKDGKAYSYNYSYADLASVSAAIMPLLGKHGLSFTSWPTLTPRGFLLRYYLLHESGEQMTGEYPLPTGATAQQLGSAITYARRYTLCSVTGISPDDDDDAAAAEGAKASRRAEQQEEVSAELANARDKVRGAWAVQFGEFNGDQAAELYRTWSKGASIVNATAGQLSNFAGYLHNLPAADAGSDPTVLPPADEPTKPPPAPGDGPGLTKLQRGKIFASLTDLGLVDAPAQREYFGRVLEREIKSRSELRAADADVLIVALEADLAEARSTGLLPQRPEGEAP